MELPPHFPGKQNLPPKLTRISEVDLKQEIDPEMALEDCSAGNVEK